MSLWRRFPRAAAWLLFWSGVAVVLGADQFLRVQSYWAPHGGLPEFVYYGIPALLGSLSAALLWRATGADKKPAIRLLEVGAHLVAGAVAYLFALLFYVTLTGIDSL